MLMYHLADKILKTFPATRYKCKSLKEDLVEKARKIIEEVE